MTRLIIISTALLLFAGLSDLHGQERLNSLSLTIKQDRNKLWSHSRLISNDTVIDLYQNYYKKSTLHDSLPEGKYTLVLISQLGDRVLENIDIKGKSKQLIDVRKYYRQDTSLTTYLDKISEKDTIKVYVDENGCFHGLRDWCEITRKDSVFFIHFFTTAGTLVYPIMNSDLELIRNLEKSGRLQIKNKTNPPYVSTTHSLYYFSCNRTLVKFGVHRPNFITELYQKYKQTNADNRK